MLISFNIDSFHVIFVTFTYQILFLYLKFLVYEDSKAIFVKFTKDVNTFIVRICLKLIHYIAFLGDLSFVQVLAVKIGSEFHSLYLFYLI